MDDYLQDFIRESEENITQLNNALLALESDPDDEAAMDSIFRTAHTLKGNFAAMGFTEASKLAHAIEDLLEEIRQERMAVSPDIMDRVFDGVDEIERMLGEIGEDGESTTDPSSLVVDIRALIEGNEADASAGESAPTESEDRGDESTGRPATDAAEHALAALDDPTSIATFETVHYAHLTMGDSQMKGVDAMLVLNEITDAFELVDAHPEIDAVQDGEYDDGFGVFIADEDGEIVESTLAEVSKIESVAVSDVTAEVTSLAGVRESNDSRANQNAERSGNAAASTEPTDDDSTGTKSDDIDQQIGNDESGAPESSDEIKSIRIDVEQLDDLHGMVEQLVTSRIKLRRSIEGEEVKGAKDNLDELDKITSGLQDTVMDMRLVPMKKVVDKFPRLIRDLARSQEKEIDFVMEGADIELDRTILNEISDPLMHLLRNSADHGIEPPGEREQSGKPREGTIRLSARRDRDRVTISVEDDGRGLDVDSIRSKAVEKGLVTHEGADAMDDEDVFDLIFKPGFSTSEEITDVSGRGVGMDVVNDTIRRLDGSISVTSDLGEGTTIDLTLPVTVAIVKVLFVESGEEEYGIPIKNVDEISRMRGVKTVEGQEVITHDEDVYPLIRLGTALDVPGAKTNGDGMLVRVRKSERQVVVHCDSVTRQEEVVVKPFDGILSGIPGLSGAAVLGEGDVVTILDVESL